MVQQLGSYLIKKINIIEHKTRIMLVYPSLSSCLLVLLVTSSFLLQKRHGKEIKQNENEMHFRKLVDEDRNFRLVISLTTSPQRLIQMENSFNSLLSQTRLPDRIYFNLPHIFKRTNDTFKNLDQLPFLSHSLIYINHCDDLGPATKLLPTLKLETDPRTLIVVVDDDVYYPAQMLATMYEAAIKNPLSPIVVHCGAEGLIANIEAEFPYQFIIPIDQTYPVCRFFDQFAGVGYRRQSFYFHIPRMQSSSLTFDEYMNISLSNSRCFRSDDLMISNFFALAGVPGIGLNHLINPRTIRPLQYSMGSDALHKLEPSGHPYFRCTMYLYELGLRSLVIKPPFEPNDHLINDFQGIWEYGNKAVIILPQDYKTNYIRHFDTATTNNATIHHPPFNYSLIRNLYQHAINQPLSVYSDNKSSGHYSTDRLEDLAYVHTMVQFVNPDKKILNVYYDGAVFCRLRKGQIKPSGSGSGSVAANNSNDIEIYVYLNEKKHLISSKSISKYLLKHGLKQENIVYVSRNVDVDIIPTGAPV